MTNQYNIWIQGYLARFEAPEACLGHCAEAVKEMHQHFPELTPVVGHVYCPAPWGRRAHRWLVTSEGDIVDPTAAQFPLIYEYEELTEHTLVRLGSCAWCGEDIMGKPDDYRPTVCSSECHDAFAASLNAELHGGYDG